MKKLKSLWPLLIVPVIVGLFINWLTPVDVIGAIWKGLRWFGHFFVIPVTFPIWGIILLTLALPAVLALVVLVGACRPPEEGYEAYRSDSFFGVSWRWRYCLGQVDENIVARCPRCQGILDFHQFWSGVPGVALTCDHCGFNQRFDSDGLTLRNRVLKEIDRKLVSGEYRSVLERGS